MHPLPPNLFTFDIFGTVLDWRRGLMEQVPAMTAIQFDQVVDFQGTDEQAGFRPYGEIIVRSLVSVLGVASTRADEIARAAGQWPLFPDSRDALSQLKLVAPCVAMTNSDHAHGIDVQAQLGLTLNDWICA